MENRTLKLGMMLIILSLSSSLSAITIERLKSNPDRYDGNIVRLRGEVSHIVEIPLTELCVYILKDRTDSIVVFSAFTKEKDERVSIKAEVVAYIGDENEREREKSIDKMEKYLVDKEILKKNAARRVSEISLKIINTITDAATGTWFIIEQEKTGLFDI